MHFYGAVTQKSFAVGALSVPQIACRPLGPLQAV